MKIFTSTLPTAHFLNGLHLHKILPTAFAARMLMMVVLCLGAVKGWAQTNPPAQAIPYSQNFGTTTFTSMPTGMAAWNGLSGPSVSTQALAEATTPSGNSTVTIATVAQTGGGVWGYAESSNARPYVQTSSNTTNGVNQLSLAINTIGYTSIIVSYDVEIISAQLRTVGIVMQYRVGTSGSWTTVSGANNPYSQAGGTTGIKATPSLTLPAAVEGQAVVQIRWATWRGTEGGNSSGIAIDNLSVTGTASSCTTPDAVSGLAASNGNTQSVVSWTNGACFDDILVVASSSTFSGAIPTGDGSAYTANSASFTDGLNTVFDGGVVVYKNTNTSVTVTSLTNGTTYNFKVFTRKGTTWTSGVTTTAIPNVVSYTWNAASGNWATPGNWTPSRTAPDAGDILIFDGGTQATPSVTIDFSSTQSISQLKLLNNTSVTFLTNANRVLNIGDGTSGVDLEIPAGSALTVQSSVNTVGLTLNVITGNIGSVSGSISFAGNASTGQTHRLTAADASAITFNNGGIVTVGAEFNTNPFGTTNLNSIVFASGSLYNYAAGNNPFGATAPNSVVVFQAGSLFKAIGAAPSPSFSGRTYANVEFAGSGTATMTGSSAAVSINNLTITSGTVNINMTGTPGHSIKGDISVASGATLNFAPASAGTLNLNGTTAQIISNSGTLTSGVNETLVVGNALGVSINNDITHNGIITIGSNTLTLNGTLSGSGTLSGTSSSNIVIGGTVGTLNFTAVSRSLNNLTLNNASSATLGTALDVYGAIALTTASLDLNAQNLTLKSNATGTARIADLTGSTLSGATNVTMERFIPQRAGLGRAYRFLASTVNTSANMRTNWMEGGQVTTAGGTSNPVTNYGTHITGSGTLSDNFDVTQNNQSSIYTATNGGTSASLIYTAVPNASSTMSATQGYFLFVRGNRSESLSLPTTPGMSTSETTLRTTGSLLLTSPQTSFGTMVGGAGALNQVTNPYPSPIDWESLRLNCTGINNAYTIWDPNMGSRGGFVTWSLVGGASSGAATRFIQSGQAFFVEASGGTAPTVSIQESDKSAGNNNGVFLTPPPPSEGFRIELYYTEPSSFRRAADGAIAVFDNNYSTGIDNFDASEINNWDENIAIARDGKHLSIESRPVILLKDTIPLFMNNMKEKAYEFEFTPAQFTNPGLKAELIDNFLNTRTLLSVTAPTVVSFTVSADPASKASDRFKVVFGSFGGLAVDGLTIKAQAKNNGVQVDWSSNTETDMLRYEVEKSTYGTTFVIANSTAAFGNSTSPVSYNWFDTNPNMGTNFYRIKGIDKAGNVRYSEIVRVLFGKGEPSIVVYPNPMEGRMFKMDLYNLVKGTYLLKLYNNTGQLVYTESLQHDGSQATRTITLKSDIAKGGYQLQLLGENGFKTTQILIKN